MIPNKYIACTINDKPYITIYGALQQIKDLNPEIHINISYAIENSILLFVDNKVVVILRNWACIWEEELFINGIEVKWKYNELPSDVKNNEDYDEYICYKGPYEFKFLSPVSKKIKRAIDKYNGLVAYYWRKKGFSCAYVYCL